MPFSIYTAFPRGYCAGVHRAINMLQEIVNTYPVPIYVNHEIIHNQFVVRMFERKGIIFGKNINEIPEWSLMVVSAHGTGPNYYKELRAKKIQWIDATCPLVEKVHREARDAIARWYHILYIWKAGHQEAIGILDEWEEHFTLIENESDITKITSEKQYTILTQTTLSVDDTDTLIKKIIEKYPSTLLPKISDICYATTNRQKAIKSLAKQTDLILVVWSKNSSNSSKLQLIAEEMGNKSYLIDGPEDINPLWLDDVSSVGITAWASGPEELIVQVIEYLTSLGGTFEKELRIIEEKVTFPYSLNIQS